MRFCPILPHPGILTGAICTEYVATWIHQDDFGLIQVVFADRALGSSQEIPHVLHEIWIFSPENIYVKFLGIRTRQDNDMALEKQNLEKLDTVIILKIPKLPLTLNFVYIYKPM